MVGMISEFPVGIVSTVGAVGLGITGIVTGNDLSNEAIEFSRNVGENADLLTYMVKNHPYITKAAGIVTGWAVGYNIGMITGWVDVLIGITRYDRIFK